MRTLIYIDSNSLVQSESYIREVCGRVAAQGYPLHMNASRTALSDTIADLHIIFRSRSSQSACYRGLRPMYFMTDSRDVAEYFHHKGGYMLCDIDEVVDCICFILRNADNDNKMRKNNNPQIKNVIFNNPATIVFWSDGTKTIVKCTDESFDPEKGLAMAISKKFLGTNKSQSNFNDIFKKWMPGPNEDDISLWQYLKSL